MSSHVTLTINEATREQIDRLARTTGKPTEVVLREVVETGLKSYHPNPTKGVKTLLDLAAWAEKKMPYRLLCSGAVWRKDLLSEAFAFLLAPSNLSGFSS